jgi:hypothetical protein
MNDERALLKRLFVLCSVPPSLVTIDRRNRNVSTWSVGLPLSVKISFFLFLMLIILVLFGYQPASYLMSIGVHSRG